MSYVYPLTSLHELTLTTDAYQWNTPDHSKNKSYKISEKNVLSGGFLSGGFLARGVFVQGVFVRGFMSGVFLSGGFFVLEPDYTEII